MFAAADEASSVLFLGLLFVGLLCYFIPTVVAVVRQHHNQTAITALNVLLGWTLLGWAGALVWALTAPQKLGRKRVYYVVDDDDEEPVRPRRRAR